METKNISGVKGNLVESQDIYNLLANLYFLCAREFTTIYNLIRNRDDYRKKFISSLHDYKQELIEKCDDIFTIEFKRVIRILERMKDTEANSFILNLWALLRAFDFAAHGDSIYLFPMNKIRCRVSNCFGTKEFILLFKPKNLIFQTIKDSCPEGKLKIGFDIGQRIEDHFQKLIFYEEHLSRKIDIRPIDPLVNQLLLEKNDNLCFAVAPVSYDFKYTFKAFKSSQGLPYIFDDIENEKDIKVLIDSLLAKCLKEQIHIVVLPELTINAHLRNFISNWLEKNNRDKTIIMVIAGSFHFLKNKRSIKYENSSVVYRFDGKPLWEQKKMNQFQLDDEDIRNLLTSKSDGLRSFKRSFQRSTQKAWENIEISDTLLVYDTVIGRMAVNICLDYFVKEKEKLLIEPNVNIIFVPAMSVSLKKMDITNYDLGTYGLSSIFCANSCWIITGGEKNMFNHGHSSYIYIPKKKGLKRLECKKKEGCALCNLTKFRLSEIFEESEK